MKKKKTTDRTNAFSVNAVCEWCKAPFMAKHPRARFCTVAHRSAAKRARDEAARQRAADAELRRECAAANAAVKKLRDKLTHSSK